MLLYQIRTVRIYSSAGCLDNRALSCLGNRASFSAANPPSEIGNSSPILALSQSLKFSWKELNRFWSFSSFRIPK